MGARGVTDAGAVDMWYNEIRNTNGGWEGNLPPGLRYSRYTARVPIRHDRKHAGRFSEQRVGTLEYKARVQWQPMRICGAAKCLYSTNTEFFCLATVPCLSQRAGFFIPAS